MSILRKTVCGPSVAARLVHKLGNTSNTGDLVHFLEPFIEGIHLRAHLTLGRGCMYTSTVHAMSSETNVTFIHLSKR